MNRIILTLCCCAFFALFPAGLRAEEGVITLEQVIAGALAKSPVVASVDARMQASLAEAVSTGILRNPSLGVSFSVPVSYPDERGDSEIDVSLAQPLRLSDFGMRSVLSDLIKKASALEHKREILETGERIKLAYFRVWALQEKAEALGEAEKRNRSILNKINGGASQGIFSAADKALFSASAAALKAEKLGAEAEVRRSRADLLALSGISPGGRKLKEPSRSALPEEAAIKAKAAEGSLPVSERLRVLRETARYQSRVAERDSFPELTPQIIYRHSDEGRDFVGVGLSIPLPFSDRNQAERIKRSAELKAAEMQEQFSFGPAFQEQIELLVSGYRASRQQAEIYRKEVLPALKEALSEMEKLFQAGQGGVMQIWQAQAGLSEAHSRAIELDVRAASERSELTILIGGDI